VALAYCHLPLVLLAAVAGGPVCWLALVAMCPWIGMAAPFLLVVIGAALAFLPGVSEGHPAAWLTPPISAILLLVGTLALFVPVTADGARHRG